MRCSVSYSCLKDHSMFIKKRKMINQASGYEKITDPTEDEKKQEVYSPDSSRDASEDSPIVPDINKEGVKYL